MDASFSLPPPVGFGPFGNNGREDFSCALRDVKGRKGGHDVGIFLQNL